MAPELEDLVLEPLRYIRAKVDKIDDDVMDLKRRATSLEAQYANQSVRIDRIEMRLDRIERRLDLAPAE